MKKYILILSLLLVLVVVILIYFLTMDERVSITIKGKHSAVSYLVEIADTQEKAMQGLMGRKSMPQDQGMLFVFPQPQFIKMWMKNTYIPLDMVFFNSHNQVIYLYEGARPMDESIISCPWPAQKVLELNAGQIRKQAIQVGDEILLKSL